MTKYNVASYVLPCFVSVVPQVEIPATVAAFTLLQHLTSIKIDLYSNLKHLLMTPMAPMINLINKDVNMLGYLLDFETAQRFLSRMNELYCLILVIEVHILLVLPVMAPMTQVL